MKKAERDKKETATAIPSRAGADLIGLRSIQFRTWLSFVTLTAITLMVLWVAQTIFYTVTFREMSKTELARSGDELAGSFGKSDFGEVMQAGAMGGGYSALVGKRGGSEIIMCADANGAMSVDHIDEELFKRIILSNDEFEKHLDKSPEGFVYMITTVRGAFMVYGHALENECYICIVKPYVDNSLAVKVLRNQLIFVTVICLIISMLLAMTFSRNISKPITGFSATAMKLGGGDFNVRFEGNGWTEIDELADTLNYATEEMGKTETLRRDFFANVSHDLRTPLTMVRAYAEMIRDLSGADPVKRAAHAQIIMDEADKLTLLVGDILDLSKLQAGTNERKVERTDMGALVKSVAERFAETMGKDGYTVESDVCCSSEVMCDKPRMEQVLYNLIGNAVNYTGADKKVSVRAYETTLCVRVEVSDTGKGIPESERNAVWERYYRSSRTKRAAKGTGLGLSIVKNILTQHDARFGVDSALGDEGEKSGTTFWFELRKCDLPAPALPAPKTKNKKTE